MQKNGMDLLNHYQITLYLGTSATCIVPTVTGRHRTGKEKSRRAFWKN